MKNWFAPTVIILWNAETEMSQILTSQVSISSFETRPEPHDTRYIAITIAFNEEKYIEKTIQSVLNQKIKPTLYIVVDDGSSDQTPFIVTKYPVYYMRVDEPKYYLGSMNMHRALTRGIEHATDLAPDWEFLLKVDADSVIPDDYFQTLHRKMQDYPKLGICSGLMKGGNVWKGRASDGAKLYRRECWDMIGGLDRTIHWDTHAIVKAYWKGWLVRAFKELVYDEERSSERERLYEWYITGITRYYLGFPLIHTIGAGTVYFKKKPYIIGSLTMILTQIIYTLFKSLKPFNSSYYNFAQKFVKTETHMHISEYLRTLKV